MEASLSHFYQSGLVAGMEGSLYPNEFPDEHHQVVELENMKEPACPESILNFILETDKEVKTQVDKHDTRFGFGLPPDPREWTVKHVNSWLAWFSATLDLGLADDLGSKLQYCQWDGSALAKLTLEDFCNVFGADGDLIYENFTRWLNVSPESLKIHDTLFDVQNDIDRLQNIKHRLFDSMVGHQVPSFMRNDYDSSMSSPPLSPPLSDDFLPHDPEGAGYPRGLPLTSEVSSTTLSWYPHSSSTSSPSSSGVYDGVRAPTLFIEPESDGSGPPAVVRAKRRRGRPRKPKPPKQKRSQPILYKFILCHLNNPGMQDKLEWVSKQNGVFRFHSARKEEFAEMWGRYKGNREQMTYQNMARALRNYTRGKTRIMERVKRKLHYKFCADFIQ